MRLYTYPYQLVTVSIWPICTSLSGTSVLISLVLYFNNIEKAYILNISSIISVIISIWYWLSDIYYEGTIKGEHTGIVRKNLKEGYLLFIVSELLIFLTLFFIFFYNSIIPNIFIGSIYPPYGLDSIPYESIPLLNTSLLLFGSLTSTLGQYSILAKNYKNIMYYFIVTIILNSIFTLFQIFEYFNASFNISDSVYGSSFYCTTGLHGVHVILGTIMILYTTIKLLTLDYSNNHHLGVWISVLYIHFVDFIWLIVLVLYYIWGM